MLNIKKSTVFKMRSVIAPVEKIGESRKPVEIDDDSDDTNKGVPKETPQDQSIEEKEGGDKQEDEENERKEEKEEGDKKEDEGKDENPKEATEDLNTPSVWFSLNFELICFLIFPNHIFHQSCLFFVFQSPSQIEKSVAISFLKNSQEISI